MLPPGGVLPPGPRSRANVGLERLAGGSGDSDLVPGRGLFSAPERIDARPFSAIAAARSVTETAVEVLRARGEPARYERLLGEILVGLDRTGQLRRLVAGSLDHAPVYGAHLGSREPDHAEARVGDPGIDAHDHEHGY